MEVIGDGVKNGNSDRKRTARPRIPAPLRGLDLDNVLPSPVTQNTIEISDDDNDAEPTTEPKHATRQSRHGKTSANYDMKVSI